MVLLSFLSLGPPAKEDQRKALRASERRIYAMRVACMERSLGGEGYQLRQQGIGIILGFFFSPRERGRNAKT